jgi:hypothetical protein
MNIVRVKTMVDLLMKIDRQQLAKIRQKQDTVALQKLIQSSFFAS